MGRVILPVAVFDCDLVRRCESVLRTHASVADWRSSGVRFFNDTGAYTVVLSESDDGFERGRSSTR